MTGIAELLRELDRRGVELAIVGDRIRYRPIAAVTSELLDSLRTHKRELLVQLTEPESDPADNAGCWARRASALLSTVVDPDRRADLRELFEHRAEVCEFDGPLPRDDTEQLAYDELRAAMRIMDERT